MKVSHRVWFELETKMFGKGPATLLKLVDQTQSLREAAKRLDLSYTKAFNLIKTAEKQLGYPLLKRTIGGESGGGSSLSEQAIHLIEKYDALEQTVAACAKQALEDYEKAQLVEALNRYQDAKLISVIGGGGKTTLVNYLVDLRSKQGETLLTSTTAMRLPTGMPVDFGVITSVGNPLAFFQEQVSDTKVKGVAPEVIDQLKEQGRFQTIVVEADGSKGLPIKSYEAHEPPIPQSSDVIFLVIGIDALHQPIEEVVHRTEVYLSETKAKPSDSVSVDNYLKHFFAPAGALKNSPSVPVVVLLNRIDQLMERTGLEQLIDGLFKEPRVDAVLLTQLQDGRLEQIFHREHEGEHYGLHDD